jgi:hypothetical protein
MRFSRELVDGTAARGGGEEVTTVPEAYGPRCSTHARTVALLHGGIHGCVPHRAPHDAENVAGNNPQNDIANYVAKKT